MKKYLILFSVVLMIFTFSGCEVNQSTDTKQTKETEQMIKEAHQKIGQPNIINFTERRFNKQVLELRDKEISTYSYFMDLNGGLHFLCESIGYGLPYSVQFTNPERKLCKIGCDGGTIPQPDPNGLFMPDNVSATFVLCTDKEGKLKPVYSEPNLIVSPFPLKSKEDLRNNE